MIVEKIRSYLDKRPFRAFNIYTSDGKVSTVKNASYAWIHPAGRTMYVCQDPTSDYDEIISLLHVTRLEYGGRQAHNRRSK